MRNNPHDKIDHDSTDWLGYDWGKVGYPNIQAKPPSQVFYPTNEEQLIAALFRLTGKVIIRANGHSNNDLVLGDSHDPVISMRQLNKILNIDSGHLTIESNGVAFVKVQSGCELGSIEDALSKLDFGLPIVPDHRHITAGGLASVGGVSSASHEHGLFVDNIIALDLIKKSDGTKLRVTGADVMKYLGKTNNSDYVLLNLDLAVLKLNIDISVFVGLPEENPAGIDLLAKDIDDVATQLSGNEPLCFRYMCTKTTFRPADNDPRDASLQW